MSTRQAILKIHKGYGHEDILYSCDQCYHESKAKQYLNIHQKIKDRSVKYLCNKCDFQARTRGKLKAHKNKLNMKISGFTVIIVRLRH